MQENFIHPECSQRMLLSIKCVATPSPRSSSVLNYNPQPPHISMVFEGSPFLPTFNTASTRNYLYRYNHVRYQASMGHDNGETAISALSLRKKKKIIIWVASMGFQEQGRRHLTKIVCQERYYSYHNFLFEAQGGRVMATSRIPWSGD